MLFRSQDQLVATSRLRAVGDMAAGVAHDFNNVLNGILGRAQIIRQLLKGDPVQGDRVDAHANHIVALAEQGAASVRRIQEFSRIRKDRPSSRARLHEAARLAAALTQPKWRDEARSRGRDVHLDLDLAVVSEVPGNPQDLIQAVSILIFNAAESMPDGGSMRIRTWEESGQVYVEVADEGQGMSAEVRQKIFEPFFTTKPQGQGLGMSVAYGIVTRLGGTVRVDSEEGKGTRVILGFPIDASPEEIPAAPDPRPTTAPPRSARLLIVDDEKGNLEVCQETLQAQGYEVRACVSGREALEHLGSGRYDLVITDLSMPGMSGIDVARNVKRHHPKTPVVLVSGWAIQQNDEDIREAGIDIVLAKPLHMDVLVDAVQRLLAA